MAAEHATNPEVRPDRPRWRLGLAGLMALIGAIAAEFGLMRNGSDGAVSIAYAVLLLALAVGLLGAIVRGGSGPWVGFSLFGWGFALLAFTPATKVCDLPPLPTNGMVEWAAERMREDWKQSVESRMNRIDGYFVTVEGGQTRRHTKDGRLVPVSLDEQKLSDEIDVFAKIQQEESEKIQNGKLTNPQWIGHSALTLIVAALGAIVGTVLERSRRPSPDPTPTGA